jgi:hypothetical protein
MSRCYRLNSVKRLCTKPKLGLPFEFEFEIEIEIEIGIGIESNRGTKLH